MSMTALHALTVSYAPAREQLTTRAIVKEATTALEAMRRFLVPLASTVLFAKQSQSSVLQVSTNQILINENA